MKNLKVFLMILLLLILLGVWAFFSYDFYLKKSVHDLNEISSKKLKTLDECKFIFNTNQANFADNKYFNKNDFWVSLNYCKTAYDLEAVELNKENCDDILANTNDSIAKNFTFLQNLDKKKKECASKFFNPILNISSYFNVYNNFKTRLLITNTYPFYREIARLEPENENYEKYQKEFKDLFRQLFVFPEWVEVKDEDIIITSDQIWVNLDLKPETDYEIKYVSALDNHELYSFKFKTPSNKYFWMRTVNPVTLYTSKHLPKFEILDFGSEKTATKVKICPISEQDYAKIEVFESTKDKSSAKKYFTENLEKFNENCEVKDLDLSKKENNSLNKYSFEFDQFLKDKKWLFFVSFVNKEDLEFNSRLNSPIFFWKADSNILMKISKDGEWFFFVNDLETGNPLANQEILMYLNDYTEDVSKEPWKTSFNFTTDWTVFSKWFSLWKTDEKWILKVNIVEKLPTEYKEYKEYIFDRTDENNWLWEGNYKTFFIKSQWENHISYLTSTWNWWIEPWNFWYSTYYWSEDEKFSLLGWGNSESLNGHLYTDRILYLPGEEVNFRGVFRKAVDLSIPEWRKLKVKINSPQETIFEKELTLNEFWSFTDKLTIPKDAPNWEYYLEANLNDSYVWWTSFNVEVFQKPKLKSEISLQTVWLDWEFVKIEKSQDDPEHFWVKNYLWKFAIKASVSSKYYNWLPVSNKEFKYKVFRQDYYEDSFWNDCFYWCFWWGNKELYTSWTWKLSESWKANFDINIDFSSDYNDYKYIVEVSVADEWWEEITSSNSVLAKLPDSYKLYNPSLWLHFEAKNSFVKKWENFQITWWLQKGKWTSNYNNNYIFVVKRKEYLNKKVTDSNWFERNIVSKKEILENIFFVNDKNFSVDKDGKLSLDYSVNKTWEYIFEYGPLNKTVLAKYLKIDDPMKLSLQDIQSVFDKFEKNQNLVLNYEDKTKSCILNNWKFGDDYECLSSKIDTYSSTFDLNTLISGWKKYLSIVSYSPKATISNPDLDDNKLVVLSDKVTYKYWETAKIFVRLPVSKSKILITKERENVKESEIIDVEGNIFTKEFLVDESFSPNTYISVFMIDLESELPQYKVWYSEIVVDKTDKKAEIELTTDKEIYSPRDEVTVNLNTKDIYGKPISSEVTLMVVDDSLISLMWNINPNTLEFIYEKYPFSIQTAMTNIAMLRNYYFSRKWVVWGSGLTDLKWWDSAVSTRNIFKNTAYFWNVVTDWKWNATVKFTLPDNLTSFRVMALSNSKNNLFGYKEKFIEVKKSVVVEDKTPIIFRNGDDSEVWAMIWNNSSKDLNLKVTFVSDKYQPKDNVKTITLKSGESKYVSWKIFINSSTNETLKYSISAVWETPELSDKMEKQIEIVQNPTLIMNHLKFATLDEKNPVDLDFKIPENTDPEKTKVELTFANNRIIWIENILKDTKKDFSNYFYDSDYLVWILDKNITLKKFTKYLKNYFDEKESNSEIALALGDLVSYQSSDWWTIYYKGWESDEYLTNFFARTFLNAKEIGIKIDEKTLESALNYLENIYKQNITDSDPLYKHSKNANIYYTLKKAGKNLGINFDPNYLNRNALIDYTYWLVLEKEKNTEQINKNIDYIIESFENRVDRKDFYSWDRYLEKAKLVSMIFDLWDEKYLPVAEKYISELYEQDWTNHYFSNETKYRVLEAFAKYLDKTYKENSASFGFSIWSHWERGYKQLSKDVPVLKYEYKLSDILNWDSLHLKALSKSNSLTYVTLSLKQYPKDKTKVKEFAHWITLTKEIFEILDENKILACQDNPKLTDCNNIFKKIETNNFEKSKTYKVKITVKSENPDIRNQLILQDYLASTMKVMNSKFLTVSSNLKTNDDWTWNNVQKNANMIQASTYTDDKELVFEYYFQPWFTWTFIAPPAIIKELYNPDRNANSSYKILQVK